MKFKGVITFFVLLSGAYQQQLVKAQNTYLDNTPQRITRTGDFNFTPYLAAQFQTGTNAEGYIVNSLQFLFADANGNPDFPYVVKCYLLSDNHNTPYLQIDSFIPSENPTNAGLHTLVRQNPSFPSVNLDASTDYWLLFSPYGGSSVGSYNYSLTDSANSVSSDGWSITGNVWPGQVGIPMFSINATAIPEPSSVSLLAAMALTTVCRRRLLEIRI